MLTVPGCAANYNFYECGLPVWAIQLEMRALCRLQYALGQQLRYFVRRQRPAEQVTLDNVAVFVGEQTKLLFLLDTLSDDAKLQYV